MVDTLDCGNITHRIGCTCGGKDLTREDMVDIVTERDGVHLFSDAVRNGGPVVQEIAVAYRRVKLKRDNRIEDRKALQEQLDAVDAGIKEDNVLLQDLGSWLNHHGVKTSG